MIIFKNVMISISYSMLFLKIKLIFSKEPCYDQGMDNKKIFIELDDQIEKLKMYIHSERKAWERANRIWEKLKEGNHEIKTFQKK